MWLLMYCKCRDWQKLLAITITTAAGQICFACALYICFNRKQTCFSKVRQVSEKASVSPLGLLVYRMVHWSRMLGCMNYGDKVCRVWLCTHTCMRLLFSEVLLSSFFVFYNSSVHNHCELLTLTLTLTTPHFCNLKRFVRGVFSPTEQ